MCSKTGKNKGKSCDVVNLSEQRKCLRFFVLDPTFCEIVSLAASLAIHAALWIPVFDILAPRCIRPIEDQSFGYLFLET